MIAIKDREFRELVEYIKKNYGINLTHKKNLIEGRLSNLLTEKGFKNFGEYIEHVFADKTGREATVLISKMTTNHTFFMREASHFEYFRDRVLPLLSGMAQDNDLRIWSAGCSTGEEPYTLAMIIQDFFGDQKPKWDTKILATDISVKALETAEEGVYSEELISKVPKIWRTKYFTKTNNNNYSICDKIKQEVIYRVFNLMDESFPFKKNFHVIFCRNVMIYFDQDTKLELINKLYQHTVPGGYLFIGHSESIPREATDYKYIMPAVYQKELI